MTTSDNDLDDLLRAAMKTLDDEVPSGYFEALPDQALARLEGDMQNGTQGTMDNQAVSPPPPVAENTEDSGLHDIRNLAQSTKQRLSSKRITVSPPVDEDAIASSSAGWKAVALPQPAKMVALPELAELPTKKEVLAKEKAAARAAKAEAKAEPRLETAAAAVEAPAAAARPAVATRPQAPRQASSKKGLYAVIGIGLAAAAGAAIFVTTQKSSTQPAPAVAQNTAAPEAQRAAPTVTPIAEGSAAVSADVQKAQEELARQEAEAERMKAELAAAQAAAGAGDKATETKADTAKAAAPKKAHATSKVETTTTKTVETKAAPKDKKPDATKPAGSDSGEPDFNELLKEAGVKDHKDKKPVLAKKELTGDDFKKGMAAIGPAAKNCYKGTQGTAMVKLEIEPSGKISKVTVSGQFAGTPEGKCVVSAVKGASFPAWDGHPQSFTYPFLLSE